jgi:hypothetical protein
MASLATVLFQPTTAETVRAEIDQEKAHDRQEEKAQWLVAAHREPNQALKREFY